MTSARRLFSAPAGPLVLAFGLALPLAALTGRLAPLPDVSGIEIGNEFVAVLGLSLALVQIVASWSAAPLRAAWASAALGAAAIVLEDRLAGLTGSSAAPLLGASVSGLLWIGAAAAIFHCGRRYAWRRAVTPVMRLGLTLAFGSVAVHLALAASGTLGQHRGLARFQDLSELAATAALVAGLALTQLAPAKTYRFAPGEIGLKARSLFYDFALERSRRYPIALPVLALPVFREIVILAVIARFFPVAFGAVRRSHGVGGWRQLGDLLRLGFAHGVDAKSYYVHELYRREPGLFEATMTRVETKNGMNRWLQSLREEVPGPRDMNDKLAFFETCEAHGVVSAPIMATVEDGRWIEMATRAAFDRDLFVKDRKGRGGRFTLNFERIGPFLYRADDGAVVNLSEITQSLRAASAGRGLIVQPKLRNHPAIRPLADRALIVFRVMTCMDLNGEPQTTHGVLRLLRRFEPGWPQTPDADWGCAIDIDTGEFGMMTGDAPETCTRWFADHPVTGERVAGRRLEGWREISELALAAHRVFASRTLVGWDIAWTPDGPVILEGNTNPDFSYFQRVSRTPVGRSPLGALLSAHLGLLAARLSVSRASPAPRHQRLQRRKAF